MLAFIVHLVVTAVLLLVVANVVTGVEVKSFGSALIGALVFGLVNALVRPVMIFLTLPFTIVTFGLFLFVVNALMLWLVSAIVPGIRINGFLPALLGSLLLTVLNIVVEFLIPGI